MSDHIAIIGAGYTGLRLAESALESGYGVVGTTRSEETLETLDEIGAEGLYWEVDDRDDAPIESIIGPDTTVVYSVPTLFRTYEADPSGPSRHVRPVERILEISARSNADNFIYLSSTSVYGDHEGEWVDETSELNPTAPAGRMRRDIEHHVLERGRDESNDLDTYVARLVGIYGPGRTLLDYIRSGRYKLVDGGQKPSNRIHVDDIVASLLAMAEEGPSGARVYNVADGHPQRVVEVIDWLVEHFEIERPETTSLEAYAETRGPNAVARWSNTYRVANDRLLDELGVRLQYETIFEGYRAIFNLE